MRVERWLLLSLLSACTRALDPCPSHMISREEEDRCVPLDAGPDAAEDADLREPGWDAGAPGDAALPPRLDASSTAPPPSEDGGGDLDAAGPADAGADASDQDAAIACAPTALALWREFHLSDQLVDLIKDCVADKPGCALGLSCALDQCLREAAGVASCESCVEAEVRCVAEHCVTACGAASDDARCRACTCANGCISEYDSCAGQALDVCADCDAQTCWNMSLPPALIMVVVSPLLR